MRYKSVDLLRGAAIIVMIEVHIFNSFLDPAIRQQSWFYILNFINGLVAPSFLFVSGFAFYISVNNKSFELRKFGDLFYKRLKRIFQILLIGYMLHIPFYSLQEFIAQIDYDGWIKFSNVDVLQCIAVGLLLLLIFRILIDDTRKFFFTILVVTFVIILFSPIMWKTDFNSFLPMPVANYLNPENGSLFPIFPWIAFIFAGAITGKYFVDKHEGTEKNKLMTRVLFIALLFIFSGHLLLSGILPEAFNSLIPNPFFFILRLGYVLAMLSLCEFISQRKSLRLNFIYDASRESLLIYWLHLQFIYLQIFSSKSLNDIFGGSFGIWESSIAAIGLILIMILFAKIWGLLKIKSPSSASKATYAFVSILLLIFLIR